MTACCDTRGSGAFELLDAPMAPRVVPALDEYCRPTLKTFGLSTWLTTGGAEPSAAAEGPTGTTGAASSGSVPVLVPEVDPACAGPAATGGVVPRPSVVRPPPET